VNCADKAVKITLPPLTPAQVAVFRFKGVNDRVDRGLQAFNRYGLNFGSEFMNNDKKSYQVLLQYAAITIDQASPPPYQGLRDTRTSDVKFHWEIFNRLYKLHPGVDWVLLLVPKDGNCYFHLLASIFWVWYPGSSYLHFYHWLRQQVCDALEAHMLDERCSACPDMSVLAYFEWQDCNSLDKKGLIDCLDVDGRSPPVRTDFQSQREHKQLCEKYQEQVKTNKKKVIERYKNGVIKARQLGAWNSEFQILGTVWAFKHAISLSVFDGIAFSNTHEFHPAFANDADGKPEMLLFSDGTHYVGAIPASDLQDFQAPTARPMNTTTHDDRGGPKQQRKW
jgi:hypothetical protein